jgi:type I restriction enzyme S subunit
MPRGEWRALADLVELRTDKVAGDKDPALPYVGLEQMASEEPDLLGVLASASSVSVNSLFHPGDILFGKLRPNLHKCVRAPFPGYCSTDILVLRPRPGCEPAFVARLFQTEAVFAEAMRTAEGTKMPRTSWEKLKAFRVFVPEDEGTQREAAQVLDALDAAVSKTRALLDKLRQVRAGLRLDQLTGGAPERLAGEGSLPRGWARSRLADLLESTAYGISVPLHEEGRVPVLRMMNLQEGEIDLADLRYSSQLEAENCLLRPGDVLFNRTNSMEHVGRTALWKGDLPRASFASYLVRLTVKPERLDPEYLVHFMNLPPVQARIKLLATPAVQQVNVNPTRLRQELCILHPVEVMKQWRIVAELAPLQDRLRAESAYLAKLRLEKRAYLQGLTRMPPIPPGADAYGPGADAPGY